MLEAGVAVSGVGVVCAQVMPRVPEDFQTWPATAIMGMLMLAMLWAMVFVFRQTYQAMRDSAAALGKMAESQGEANRRADEQAGKQGETNKMLGEMVTELRVRPCLTQPKKKNGG
jgi:hypothetical protein